MSANRPKIPLPIKRAVRQRCAFGCVLCGRALYEYDHIVPYSQVQEHTIENLVLLCGEHHQMKTAGLLPTAQVTAASQAPHNSKTLASSPLALAYAGPASVATIGSNAFYSLLTEGEHLAPIIIDDVPVVLFEVLDNHLFLTLQLFDRNHELLVQIAQNELVYSSSPWDVEFVGQRLTVRNASRDIFVSMKLQPPAEITLDSGHVWCNGIEIEIAPTMLVLGTRIHISRSSASNIPLGVALGDVDPTLGGALLRIDNVPRTNWPTDAPADDRIIRFGDLSTTPAGGTVTAEAG